MFNFILNLFKSKSKEPEIIYTKDDLEAFKDKIITEEDADKIVLIQQYIENSQNSDFLFGSLSYNKNGVFLRRGAYKQAILDYAYLNFKNLLNQDKFGESHADSAYYKACRDNGEDSSSIAAGYYALPVLGRYFYGWSCAKELNLKCENEIKVNFKI